MVEVQTELLDDIVCELSIIMNKLKLFWQNWCEDIIAMGFALAAFMMICFILWCYWHH